MKIHITDGAEAGKALVFDNASTVEIGRDSHCGVCLADRKASRVHARLVPRGGKIFLEDLASANGTRVNGIKIKSAILSEDDKIRIGDTLFTVTGLPAPRPGQLANRMIRVADRSRTVILNVVPQQQASVLGHAVPPNETEALRAAHRHLQVIGEISQSLARQRDTDESLHAVIGILLEACGADTACVLTRQETDTEWTVRAVRTREVPDAQLEISETIIRQSLDEGVAILCRDPILDARFRKSASIVMEGVTSAICTPMRFGNACTGVLFLDRRHRKEVFTEQDLRLTATVANILSLMLSRTETDSKVV
jgi:pSer/pThr/pTyr-binding forkhead associated (FHA) protein